jgi:phosphoribosylaminoimidazole (AIR) synthetase
VLVRLLKPLAAVVTEIVCVCVGVGRALFTGEIAGCKEAYDHNDYNKQCK